MVVNHYKIMKNIFKLKIPLYSSTIWLFINPTYEEIVHSKLKSFKEEDSKITIDLFNDYKKNYDGLFFENGLNMRILIFTNKLKIAYNVIPHESAHAARNILNKIGAESIDDEVFAYLLGHITEFCFTKLDEYNNQLLGNSQ